MKRLCLILSLGVLLPAPRVTRAVCPLGLERVALGLNRPVGVAWPDDGSNRLFVIEQHTGRIRIVDLSTGAMRETPFLDLAGLAAGNEQGLLGLAFDPLYVDNGLLYVNVTVADGTTEIRRYRTSRTDPDLADASSEVVLLSYAQPFSNHNGGWLAFGPDGCLYISTGDGGSAFDPGNRAQSLNTLLANCCASTCAEPTARPAGTASRLTIHSSTCRTPARRSGPTASAIPGGAASTAPRAICTSATSARTRSRRSTFSLPPTPAARIMAGA